jgi:hypothetical protein
MLVFEDFRFFEIAWDIGHADDRHLASEDLMQMASRFSGLVGTPRPVRAKKQVFDHPEPSFLINRLTIG